MSRYLFENPWPGTLVLVLAGALLAWRALSEGRRGILVAGFVAMGMGACLFVLAALVTTPGEHARATVRRLVQAAAAADVATASSLFEDDATINFDDPSNPSMGRGVIDRGLGSLADRNRIESNRVSALDGTTIDRQNGLVELACWTQTASSMGTVPSRWLLRVRRQPDGTWRVSRVTCVSIAGRPVGAAVW